MEAANPAIQFCEAATAVRIYNLFYHFTTHTRRTQNKEEYMDDFTIH
jgi:hypothetical protein